MQLNTKNTSVLQQKEISIGSKFIVNTKYIGTLIESEGSEPDKAAFLAAARLSTSSVKIRARSYYAER